MKLIFKILLKMFFKNLLVFFCLFLEVTNFYFCSCDWKCIKKDFNKDSNASWNWDFQKNKRYCKIESMASALNLCIHSKFKENQNVMEDFQIIPSHKYKCQIVTGYYDYMEICLQ